MGKFVFVNPKTGKKERHICCAGCCEFIPTSEYDQHKCPNEYERLMWL